MSKPNPRVFLDISINKSPPERLVIELFADVVPKTAENFRALCVGDKGIGSTTGKPLHYKGCIFHEITKGLAAQGGDFSKHNGTGGESIYGKTFPDENFKLYHSGPGILSMANVGPNTNGSQFFISFDRQPFFDGCHVVFGKVIRGLETVQDIEQMGRPNGKPKGRVEITDCGEISLDKKSNVIESDIPQSSSVRKEEPESNLQKDNDSKKYESATLKNNVLVTTSNHREVTFEKPHQHSDDPIKSRGDRRDRSKKSESPISEDKKNNVTVSDKGEEMSNPRVFLDISVNKSPPQRLVIELFADVVPKTAENFRALCVGDKGIGSTTGKPLHYKGCIFHDITTGLVAQGGDFSKHNGTGGESIYGKTFPDENFKLYHSGPGILSMANVGANTNGSQFFISFDRQPFLDGGHVVFGKVIRGLETVQDIQQMGRPNGKPKGRVEITDCGEISQNKKSNVIESDIPQSSSVRKKEPESNLQKDNDSKKYESATLKNNVLVTTSDDREVTFEKPHQHSDDPIKSRTEPNPLEPSTNLQDFGEEMSNPHVFLDISINKSPPQRLVIELFADVVPKTAENFRALCVGDKGNGISTGKPLHYKGCVFYQIIKGFFAQGGDFSKQNGTGGESIYGNTFPDENFKLDHTGPGILSMANDGRNTNGSRCHVVFGKVIKGMESVQNIELLGTTSGRPIGLVEITDCGEIPRDAKSKEQRDRG